MEISIIVAAKNASLTIRSVMDSLLSQINRDTMELIVADASVDDTPSIIETAYPQARLLKCPAECLIPELWSRGLFESCGEIVVIFSAQCIPDKDWMEKAQALLAGGWDGVGSAIRLNGQASALDRAIYLCRYARYIPPFISHATWDLPGDCAAYRRENLFQYQELFKSGFWEPAINRRMVDEGNKLRLDSNLQVELGAGGSASEFLANRYQHGCKYGLDRAVSRLALPVYLLATLFLPVLLLFRSGTLACRKGVSLVSFCWALPWLFLFFVAWSAGEAKGYAQRLWNSPAQAGYDRT